MKNKNNILYLSFAKFRCLFMNEIYWDLENIIESDLFSLYLYDLNVLVEFLKESFRTTHKYLRSQSLDLKTYEFTTCEYLYNKIGLYGIEWNIDDDKTTLLCNTDILLSYQPFVLDNDYLNTFGFMLLINHIPEKHDTESYKNYKNDLNRYTKKYNLSRLINSKFLIFSDNTYHKFIQNYSDTIDFTYTLFNVEYFDNFCDSFSNISLDKKLSEINVSMKTSLLFNLSLYAKIIKLNKYFDSVYILLDLDGLKYLLLSTKKTELSNLLDFMKKKNLKFRFIEDLSGLSDIIKLCDYL